MCKTGLRSYSINSALHQRNISIMKTQTGIWIDGKKAIIIELQDGQEVIREIHSQIDNPVHHSQEGDKGSFVGNRHLNNEKKFMERELFQMHSYMEEVMLELKDDCQLFIMGPAGMKFELRKKITDDRLAGQEISAVEAADYITLNQMVAKVKSFFASK
jgi:hypothetical protein